MHWITAITQLEPRPTIDDPIIHPVSASAGSTYGSNQNPMNVINGVGLDGDGLDAKHDDERSAKTMWHTASNPEIMRGLKLISESHILLMKCGSGTSISQIMLLVDSEM